MDIKTIRLLGVALILFSLPALVYGQDKKEEEEINYVWIDTMVTIDESEVRIVSNDIIRISCCMKSPKYSRVSAKAVKWIRKTFDPEYEGTPFKTLQNLDLATTVIESAKSKSVDDASIKMIDYEYKCDG